MRATRLVSQLPSVHIIAARTSRLKEASLALPATVFLTIESSESAAGVKLSRVLFLRQRRRTIKIKSIRSFLDAEAISQS